MIVTKFISATRDSLKRLIVKIQRFGRNDIQTAYQIGPFGFDAHPTGDNIIPIYAPTNKKGENVIVGYLLRDQLTEPGQVRLWQIFEGNVGTELWLRNNFIELGDDANHVAMYEPLDTELQLFKSSIQAELTKIATGIAAAGGSYTPGTLVVDISGARSTKTKTG